MSTGTVYERSEYADVDIGEQMRYGHPYIAEGDDVIVGMVKDLAGRRAGPARVLEIGSGSGYLTERLRHEVPAAELVANEIEPALVSLARRRFAGTGVEVFDGDFQDWDRRLDVLISWGSHHHLSNAYLAHAARLLGDAGTLLLGDEFCPSYLTPEDAERVRAAEVIHLARGHLLTTFAEVAEFDRSRRIPAWSLDMERRRRAALWTWYKHVIDVAFERGDDVVIAAELQIAQDDLRTEFGGEHKLAPEIVLRDLELNGFVARTRVALEGVPQLASFFIFELVPIAREDRPRGRSNGG